MSWSNIWDIRQNIAKAKEIHENSDIQCYRCKNFIWKSGGVYFRPKDGKWIPFCRVDCAQLHVGKKATLVPYEDYVSQVMHAAIKAKPK